MRKSRLTEAQLAAIVGEYDEELRLASSLADMAFTRTPFGFGNRSTTGWTAVPAVLRDTRT